MPPVTPATFAYAAVSALILWRVVARFRRAVGRQRLSRYRAPLTLGIYGLATFALVRVLRAHPGVLAELLAAGLLGAALGHHAFRRTRLEPTPQGLFYTPYSPIALSIAVLFAARIAWRVFELAGAVPLGGLHDFMTSPLTIAPAGLLIGYNVCYTVRLACWRRAVLEAGRKRESGM